MRAPCEDPLLQSVINHKLDPATGWRYLLGRAAGWLCIAVISVVYYQASGSVPTPGLPDGPLLWLGVSLIALTHIVMPLLTFRFWSWSLRERDFLVQHGLWVRQSVSIPLSRIQQVDLHRSLLDRLFGLAQLRVHSAGSRAARVDLPGIAAGQAAELQTRLTELGDQLAG